MRVFLRGILVLIPIVSIFMMWQYLRLDSMVVEMPTLAKSANLLIEQKPKVETGHELPEQVSFYPHSTSNSVYTWQRVDAEQSAEYSEVLAYELSKYPSGFFERAGIDNIFVVDDIKGSQSALGFADTATGDVYLDLPSSANLSNEYVVSTIHHEIAHLYFIKLAGYGVVKDAYWGQIFSNEAVEGGSFPESGFVSKYATYSIAEDMAEVFAFMLTDGYREQLAGELDNDYVLKQKVDYILQLNSRFYPDSGWLFPY